MATEVLTRPQNQKVSPKPDSLFRKTVRRFLRHRLAIVGLVILVVIVFLAVFAPLVARYDPNAVDLSARSAGPSGEHWFGTDRVGRDVFSRTIYGGQISLLVGVIAVTVSVVVAAVLGSISGYFGGLIDNIIMRFTDIVMTFPPIIIVLTVAALIGPGVFKTMLVIGLLNWPVPCRLVRSKFLSLRKQEFVTAAKALGVPTWRIIFRHIFPNALDVLIVYISLGIANAILLEAGLSFLGLGVEQPTPSWGNLLNAARNISILEQNTWQWLPAGAAIVLTILAINFIGDGLRDALDPRQKS